jgi:sarcosine oxidase subunit beta
VTRPDTADVVVIGAGIVGCAAAYHLAAAGAGRVVVLDREDAVGRGSTGACAGGFRHQFTTEVNVRLSLASVPMIVGFTEEHGIPLDISRDGYLFLVREGTTWERFVRGVELQRSLGARVEVLAAGDAAAMIPGLDMRGVIGATFGPDDGIADPGALTQGYATLATRVGAAFRLGTPVERILAQGERVVGVRTPAGDITASSVVLAAGPWSASLAATVEIDLPVEPVPRVVVTTAAFPGVPTRRTLVIDADTSFYFHRESDGVLMGMGGRDDPSFSTAVDDRFVTEELLPKAVEIFPSLAEAGVRSSWAGLYEMTPDRHPVVGRTPVEGLFVAAGFSGHGFQHGPIVGKLLAELMVDGEARTVDISALSLERFARGALVHETHVV